MTLSEEDAKPFARFWFKDQIDTYDKMAQQLQGFMKAVLKDMPRNKEGTLEDDHFRGTEESIESFVTGLREGLAKQFAGFDEAFNYQWYRYQKDGHHGQHET